MTTNSHAKLLERYLSLICDGDPEARRLGYGAWFRRYGGASLAVGTMLALAGCGDGSQKDEGLTSGGGESSVGGDIQSAAGLGQGGAAASQGGSAGTGRGGAAAQQGGAQSFGGVAGNGQGGAIGRGGSAGTGQGGVAAQQGGAPSFGGVAGSGQGGISAQGGTSGAAQGGQEQGGSAGAAQGGQEPQGGTAGAGFGGNGEGGLVWSGGSGPAYGVPFETNCGNGRDDDFDGDTDCRDADCMSMMSCAADYAVPMEVCDDRVDNDHDGAVDCDDINCAGDPSCEGSGGAGGGGGVGGNGGEGGATTDGIYVTLSGLVSEGCPAGTERTLTLHNDTSTEVFLPGCANYLINDMPDAICTTEGIGRIVPALGTFEATYRCPDESGTITLCFEVSYGCTPDLPLSQASCTGSESFCAEPFTLIPLP